jgi:hypothetical protein
MSVRAQYEPSPAFNLLIFLQKSYRATSLCRAAVMGFYPIYLKQIEKSYFGREFDVAAASASRGMQQF